MTETAKYGVRRTIIKVVDLDMEGFDWLIESDRSTSSFHDVGLGTKAHFTRILWLMLEELERGCGR